MFETYTGTIEILATRDEEDRIISALPRLRVDELLPVPEELLVRERRGWGHSRDGEPRRLYREVHESGLPSYWEEVGAEERLALLDTYGAETAAEWRAINWGGGVEDARARWEGTHPMKVPFRMEGGPPTGIARELSRKFPSVRVTVLYDSSVCSGWSVHFDGELVAQADYEPDQAQNAETPTVEVPQDVVGSGRDRRVDADEEAGA